MHGAMAEPVSRTRTRTTSIKTTDATDGPFNAIELNMEYLIYYPVYFISGRNIKWNAFSILSFSLIKLSYVQNIWEKRGWARYDELYSALFFK